MERKEHPVATISGGGKVLKLIDPDGNPYTPPEPVDYQILDEDGEILKEGTIKDTDEIPLDDVSATSFRVMIDSHLVLDTQGFESPWEDEDHQILEGPSFDPEDDALSDDFTDVSDDDSGKDAETDSEKSGESSNDSQGEGQDTSDEGSEDSSDSDENESDHSDVEGGGEDADKESSDDKEESSTSEDSQSDSEESDTEESDSNKKAPDDSD